MPIQYAGGTNVNATFLGDTKVAIVDGIKVQLVIAGWTVQSGASGDWILRSALTPQSLQCDVRLFSPAGNTARVSFRNVNGTVIGTDCFLLPAGGRTFRIIANKYQFFVMVPGSFAVSREFAAGGVPFLETFLTVAPTPLFECIWSQSNANSDTSTTLRSSFRTSMYVGTITPGNWQDVNGQVHSGGASAAQRLICLVASEEFSNDVSGGRRWHNDEALKIPARLAMGFNHPSFDLAEIRGQLWDAVVIENRFSGDITASFDSKNWYNITDNNDEAFVGQMSLWLVIP